MPTRILIIDDDPVLSRVMADALAEYNVTLAQTAEVGLELYEKEPFDLVLCDLVLPGMSGTEFIERIREKYPQARLIVASAQGSGENLLATLRQNVVDFLVKPFDTEDLRCAVSNLLAADQSIEVVSATPSWVELRVPASFQIAASLESFFNNLQVGIDETTQRNVSIAFRELVNNAIEHGAKGDAARRINISYVRFDRAIMYRIQDPGSGFDFADLPHAAVSYPGDPLAHIAVRQEQGLRAGGYGLLWIQNLADQVVFNELRNQVIFIKYLDSEKKPN
jgi:DNA-binding response OmpR family regulator